MANIADIMRADMANITRAMDRMFIGIDPSVYHTLNKKQSFPCYNIIQECDPTSNTPTSVRIDMALAGYSADQLDVIVDDSKLWVGTKENFKETKPPTEYVINTLHQGITNRKFEIVFPLGPQLSETPTVTFRDGILSIKFDYQIQDKRSIPILTVM